MTNLNDLYEAILAGNLEKSIATTNTALAEGANPQSLIRKGLCSKSTDECSCHEGST